jgi:hypothetical protein
MSNYFQDSEFGKTANALLQKRKITNRVDAAQTIAATVLVEYFKAKDRQQERDLTNQLVDLEDEYKPIMKNLEGEFIRSQQNKKILEEYDRNPTKYVNTQILNDFPTSDFAVKNRIEFKDLKQLQGTQYEPAYNNWVEGRKKEINEKIALLRKDPLLQYKSYEELTQDIAQEIKTKARSIKQDPANKNLLNGFFNDVKNFFGIGAKNQVEMEIAVEDSKSEYENIMNPIREFENQLKNYHTKLANKQQPEFIGFFRGQSIYNKYFKDIDKDQKTIIESDFESVKNNEYELQLSDNPEQTITSTPFDDLNNIKVLVETPDNKLVEDKNRNAKIELAKLISYSAAYQKADNDERGIDDVGTLTRNSRAIERLVETGVLSKESRFGQVVLKIPKTFGLRQGYNILPEAINEVNALVSDAEQLIADNTQPFDEAYNSYFNELINTKRNQGLDVSKELSRLSRDDEKEYVSGNLQFLFNPPEEVKGKFVMLPSKDGERRIELGAMSESEKLEQYNNFKTEFQSRDETLERLLGIGEEPFREATGEELDEMLPTQQRNYRIGLNTREKLLQKLDNPEANLSEAEKDRARDRIKEVERNLNGLIENRGFTVVGKALTDAGFGVDQSKLFRVRDTIKNIEARLQKERTLRPDDIQSFENRLKELKAEEQALEEKILNLN